MFRCETAVNCYYHHLVPSGCWWERHKKCCSCPGSNNERLLLPQCKYWLYLIYRPVIMGSPGSDLATSKPNNRTRNYRPGQLFSVGVAGIVLFVSVVLRKGASIPYTRCLCRHHLRDAIFVCAFILYGPTVERVYGQTVVASTIPFIVLQTVNTSCQDYSQTINIRYPSRVYPSSSYLRRRAEFNRTVDKGVS